MRNFAAVLVLSLALSGCGSKETPRPETDDILPSVSSGSETRPVAEPKSETGTVAGNSGSTALPGSATDVPPRKSPDTIKEEPKSGTPEAGTGVDETEIREATSEIDRLFEGIADAPSEKSETGTSR